MKKNSLSSLQAEFRNDNNSENNTKTNVDDLIESLSRQFKTNPQKRQFLFSPPKAAVPKPLTLDDNKENDEDAFLLSSRLDDILQLDASFALSSPSKSATFSPLRKNTLRKISFKKTNNKNNDNEISSPLSASRNSVFSAASSSRFRGSVKRLDRKTKILEAEIDLSKKEEIIAQYEMELNARRANIAQLRVEEANLKQEKNEAQGLLEKKKKFVEGVQVMRTKKCSCPKIETKDEATSPITTIQQQNQQDEIIVDKNNEIISKSSQKRACLTALQNVNEKRRNIALHDRSNEANASVQKTAQMMADQSKTVDEGFKISRLFPFI